VISYETLQEDFNTVLDQIGIIQKRPIPVFNKTTGKDDSAVDNLSPEAITHVRKIFGPFMSRSGYEFPASWGEFEISKSDHRRYTFWHQVRRFYWLYIRRI